MIINSVFTYRKNIVLTVERMKELKDLLLKHGDSIKYTAVTSNKAEITFDSFDELCGFNNFGEGKIVSLNLNCRKTGDYSFCIDTDFLSADPFYKDSVRCKYCFSSVDSESVFVNDLKRLLEKTAKYNGQYRTCYLMSCVFLLLLGVGLIFIPINGSPIYKTVSWPILYAILLSIEFIARGLHILFVKHILNRLYPRVIFAWGEESESYERLKNLRSNLFWGVIVATIISLTITLVSSLV